MSREQSDGAGRFFTAVVDHPRVILGLTALVSLGLLAGLPLLTKDTRADAFLPRDHASLELRDRVREVFGLEEPVVVAVVREAEGGIYRPQTLALVDWLTRKLEEIEGLDADQIVSLATENDVIGDEEGIAIRPFLARVPTTISEAAELRRAVERFPLYLGSLVARDGSATVVVGELHPEADRAAVYDRLVALVQEAPVTDEELHVAGEGALYGHMGRYIDHDMKRVTPLAFVAVSLVLLVSYRTARGVMVPHAVSAMALLTALGTMAWAGVPMYLTSNGILVLLIAIAVADGIHVLGKYYEEQAQDPAASARELAVRSMVGMWRPVTITSVTDMAGFLALYAASFMPPMEAFGLFAAIGVAAALLFALFPLPVILSLLPPRSSPALRVKDDDKHADSFARAATTLGGVVLRHPRALLVIWLVAGGIGVWGVLRLNVDDEPLAYFQEKEPIYRAERAINATLDGTHHLDVVLEAKEPGVFYEPKVLRRVEDLRLFMESLPEVRGATAITGHIRQMHRALNADAAEAYRIPDDPALVAQSLLLYEMDAGPTALDRYVDSDFQRVHVRARLGTGQFSRTRAAVEPLERYLEVHFGDDLQASMTGRVEIEYRWMARIAHSTATSIALALLAVWSAVVLAFRSLRLGTLVMAPVSVAVLLVYGVMGLKGMWLSVSGSMWAAIAIGASVDFAVHTLDRVQEGVARGASLRASLESFYPTTARALLFNFACMSLGFLTLCLSQAPSVISFGALVAVAATVAFVASVTLLPALLLVLRPQLVVQRKATAISIEKWTLDAGAE